MQRKAELGDVQTGLEQGTRLAAQGDGLPVAALRSSGSEPADPRMRQGGKRRLALGELVVDGTKLRAGLDDTRALEIAEHADAHGLHQVGELAVRQRPERVELKLCVVLGRREDAVEKHRVVVRIAQPPLEIPMCQRSSFITHFIRSAVALSRSCQGHGTPTARAASGLLFAASTDVI